MKYTRKLEHVHTDCQYHWEQKYNEYTKEEMRDIIIDLLETIWEAQANMDSMKVELEDSLEEYTSTVAVEGSLEKLVEKVKVTIEYLDSQASDFYSINL